jgi:hypothetical protein
MTELFQVPPAVVIPLLGHVCIKCGLKLINIFKEHKAESRKQKAIAVNDKRGLISAKITRCNSFLLFAFCFPLSAL